MGWTMAAKMMSVLPRGPMNVTLLPDGVFGDVISLRWAQTELGGPSSNVTRVLIRQEETQKQTRRVESRDSMDTRLGGPPPPANECLKLPEAGRCLLQGLRTEHGPVNSLISDLQPPELWEYISVVLNCPLGYDSPGKLTQSLLSTQRERRGRCLVL